MRRDLARQRDILLRDQRDAVLRCDRRCRIHDTRRIHEGRTIRIRRLTIRIGMEYGARLDHAVRLRDRTLCRSDDHTVLCVNFARKRDPGITCRVPAPQRAVIQKPRPLHRRFLIEVLVPVKIDLNRSRLRRHKVVAVIERVTHRRIRPERQAAHIEDTMRADRDTCIREEIHVPADLVILDRIHHAVDVDLILDHIDLVICLSHMQVRHIVLLDAEIIEVVQRIAILHLLVRDVVLRAAIRKVVCRNFILILLIRHRHIRIAEMASRAPARNGKEQRRPCAREDTPAAAHALLALMGFDQLGADHIAAARCIPYDFVYFIHEMASFG